MVQLVRKSRPKSTELYRYNADILLFLPLWCLKPPSAGQKEHRHARRAEGLKGFYSLQRREDSWEAYWHTLPNLIWNNVKLWRKTDWTMPYGAFPLSYRLYLNPSFLSGFTRRCRDCNAGFTCLRRLELFLSKGIFQRFLVIGQFFLYSHTSS